MEYRAVGTRCAVDIDALELPVSKEHALTILFARGFVFRDVDLIAIARSCIGTSAYRRGARLREAPDIVDCSSFIKWLYGLRGVWLPRRSVQQRECGETISLERVTAGDVVFTSGYIDYYHSDIADGVGHVGMATGADTVIHAANKKAGVIETPLDVFVKGKFRGAQRYIPNSREVLTLETPASREVETADDVRWIIMQSL